MTTVASSKTLAAFPVGLRKARRSVSRYPHSHLPFRESVIAPDQAILVCGICLPYLRHMKRFDELEELLG